MSKQLINAFIREIKIAYNGKPWYGDSMVKVLQNMDPAIISTYPITGAHSIAEIACHVLAWREFLLQRLQGNDSFSVKQEKSFNWTRIDPVPQKAWPKLLEALDKNQQQIIVALSRSDDTLLDKKVAARNYNFKKLIQSIILHDVYHLGQIVLLKKNSSG